MATKSHAITVEQIDEMIHTIRGTRVMLDRDLAKIYGVPTFRFNEAIKRNRHRFPGDFAFQLTAKEFASLRLQVAMTIPQTAGNREDTTNSSQIAMSSKGRRGAGKMNFYQTAVDNLFKSEKGAPTIGLYSVPREKQNGRGIHPARCEEPNGCGGVPVVTAQTQNKTTAGQPTQRRSCAPQCSEILILLTSDLSPSCKALRAGS